MLVLNDLPWWLGHPEELARVLAVALEYQSEEPADRGPIEWYGHNRAEIVPDTPRGGTVAGALAVRKLEYYAEHPEEMRAALQIRIAMTRQRDANEVRTRDVEDRGMERLPPLCEGRPRRCGITTPTDAGVGNGAGP